MKRIHDASAFTECFFVRIRTARNVHVSPLTGVFYVCPIFDAFHSAMYNSRISGDSSDLIRLKMPFSVSLNNGTVRAHTYNPNGITGGNP